MNKKNIENYLAHLKQLSKIVLKSDFAPFWERVKALKESEKFYFEDEGDYYLNPYVKPYYNENFQGGLWKDDIYYFSFEEYFLHQAENEEGLNKLLAIDWMGESEEGEFAHFVQESLEYYGIKDFDISFWGYKSKKVLNELEIEREDYILFQFEAFDKRLKEIDFHLIFINNASDEYYPIVVNQEEYEMLDGMSVGSFSIQQLIKY